MPEVTDRRWFRMTVLALSAIAIVAGFWPAVAVTMAAKDLPSWYVVGWGIFIVGCIVAGAIVGPSEAEELGANPTTGFLVGIVAFGGVGSLAGAIWPTFTWLAITVLPAIRILVPWVDRGTPQRKG